MNNFAKTFLTVAATMLAVSGLAYADIASIEASLDTPLVPAGSFIVPIAVAGVSAPSQSPISGTNFNVSFNVAPPPTGFSQGLVNGQCTGSNSSGCGGTVGNRAGNQHAVPVAGSAGGSALYLSGDFGSGLTNNIGASGNYFSTGASGTGDAGNPTIPNASITLNLTNSGGDISLALLWGSIDPGAGQNILTFMNGSTVVGTVTGAEVQAAANSLTNALGNGFFGNGGSAYVVINTTTPFTSVIASNVQVSPGNRPSFEFAGVAAGTEPFVPIIPEPNYFWPLSVGLGITAAVAIGRHRRKDVLRS